MKFLLLTFLTILPVSFSSAAYPASCPVEVQPIVDAVGGCAAISCSQYEAICAKCCPSSSTPKSTSLTTFYIKPATANLRECPARTCQVIRQLPQNTSVELQYRSLNELPEWVEYSTGYISKTVLSDRKTVAVSPPPEPTPPPVKPAIWPFGTPMEVFLFVISMLIIAIIVIFVSWSFSKILLYLSKNMPIQK